MEGLEALVYKILTWVFLIPKTIIKIILNPGFVSVYVKNELAKERKNPFDEYMSPILLYLTITLLPTLALNLIPQFGIRLITPVDGHDLNREIYFESQTVFKLSTKKMGYEYEWLVWRCNNVNQKEVCGDEIFVASEKHNSADGVYVWNHSNGEYEPAGIPAQIQVIDHSTVKDSFSFSFREPGNYFVSILVENFHPDSRTITPESYYDHFYIYVPYDTNKPLQIFSEFRSQFYREKIDLVENLQSTNALLLGIAFLFPPLLFAMTINVIRKRSISESSLRENFYTQCYYFSPIGVTYWAAVYSTEFALVSESYIIGGVFLLLLLAIFLWFILVEINTIAQEGNTNKWVALLILLILVGGVSGLTQLYFSSIDDPDILRKSIIYIFPGLSVLFVISAIILRVRKWIKRKIEVSNSKKQS
jgi:hypothetical protein